MPALRRPLLLSLALPVAFLVATPSVFADPPPPRTHVVLIGGFDSDPTPEQLAGTASRGTGNSGLYQMRGDLLRQQISAEYFNWNGTAAGQIADANPPGAAAIVQHVLQQRRQQPATRLAIVGNSMGGHTAWEVCDRLSRSDPAARVQLVVFLDPSSVVLPEPKRPTVLPANVDAGVQYASRTAVIWGPWPDEPRIKHIDLGDPREGYLRPGGPRYDAVFSLNAHIGAEWDERIHADICRRLLQPTAR